MREIILERLYRATELCDKKFHKNAIEESLSVLEIILKFIYKEVSVCVSSSEKKKILEIEEEVANGKSIDKMMIGQLIGIFEKAHLYKMYATHKHIDLSYLNISNLHQINDLRVKCTHDDYKPTKNEAKLVELIVRNIIDELKIDIGYVSSEKIDEENDKFEEIKPKKIQFNNLPRPEYIEFIGRIEYIEDVIKLLASRSYIISIDGIGGVGKSALALEVGKKCWDEKLFDAVIWISAKLEGLSIVGIQDIVPSLTSFESLLDTILNGFSFKIEEKIEINQKEERVKEILRVVPTLLIVDNLETIDDPDIFRFLKDLPNPSKALVTSRKRLGEVERVIQLEEFSLQETKDFLNMESKYRKRSLDNFEEVSETLHNMTGGIPLALKLIVGWLNEGYSIDGLEKKITGDKSQITKFCFEECYNNLMDNDSRQLFCVFPVLPKAATKEQIIVASQLSGEKCETSLQKLIHLSVINKEFGDVDEGVKETYYSMLPLTLSFAHEKLTMNRGLEKDARKSLAKYFELNQMTQDALIQYGLALEDLGGQTEKGRTSAIISNLAFATFQRGNYPKSIKLFEQAIKTDPKLSYSYQLWATVERQQGNYTKAEELFKRASKLNPKNSVIWSSWAMMKKDGGDLIGASALLENAQKYQKDSFISQQLSVIKSMLGKFSEATSISFNSLEKNPKNRKERWLNTLIVTSLGENYWKWGLKLQDEKDLNTAEGKFQRGIEIIEENSKIVFSNNWKLMKQNKKLRRALGIIKRKKSEYTDAEMNFSLSLYKKPENRFQYNHNCNVQFDRVLNYKYWNKVQEMNSLAKECIEKYKDPRFIEFAKSFKVNL